MAKSKGVKELERVTEGKMGQSRGGRNNYRPMMKPPPKAPANDRPRVPPPPKK